MGKTLPTNARQPIIECSHSKLLHHHEDSKQAETESAEEMQAPKKMIFLQYQRKVTGNFCRELRMNNTQDMPVLTFRKLKSTLPLLKCSIDHSDQAIAIIVIRSYFVHKVMYALCYVGWTSQYTSHQFQELTKPSQPIG